MPAITPANYSIKTIQHRTGFGRTRTYEVRNAGYFGKPIKNGTKNLYDAKIVEKFIADWQAGKIAIPPRKKRDNETDEIRAMYRDRQRAHRAAKRAKPQEVA